MTRSTTMMRLDPGLILQIFPSAISIQDDKVPSDLQNDYNFLVEFVKSQLISPTLIQPNQRIKSAIKAVNSSQIDMLDVVIDIWRNYITSLQLQTVDELNDLFMNTAEKCRHITDVLQFNYQQSQLLFRSCSSTFQSVFIEQNFIEKVAHIFEQVLFTGQNEELIRITNLLRSLSLTENLEEVIIDLTTSFVSKKVSQEYLGNFTRDMNPLLTWSSTVVYPILEKFLPPDEFNQTMLHEVTKNEMVKLRTQEIFDMVLQFPLSTRALNELRFSISSQGQREQLVSSFIHSCNTKLLHAGTDTVKIIQYYMKSVRSFLVIDPRGVLLDKASRPIRKYLRTRDETIERIVNGLLDTSQNAELGELLEELNNTKTNSVDVDDINDANWTPDPIDALPDFRKKKVGDLIESLFSIFDSRSVFVEMFVKRFSDDLAKLTNYDVTDVMTNLNFLKLRFGEDEFNSIDVMVNDIVQSQTIDSTINPGIDNFHTSIISHLYWPVEDYLGQQDPPPFMKKAFDSYCSKFGEIKRGRNLKLIPSMGTVDLDLDFLNGSKESFTVSPDKAIVIYAFNDQTNMSYDQLVNTLLIDPDQLTDILKFWVKEEVLYEISPQIYAVNEDRKLKSI